MPTGDEGVGAGGVTFGTLLEVGLGLGLTPPGPPGTLLLEGTDFVGEPPAGAEDGEPPVGAEDGEPPAGAEDGEPPAGAEDGEPPAGGCEPAAPQALPVGGIPPEPSTFCPGLGNARSPGTVLQSFPMFAVNMSGYVDNPDPPPVIVTAAQFMYISLLPCWLNHVLIALLIQALCGRYEGVASLPAKDSGASFGLLRNSEASVLGRASSNEGLHDLPSSPSILRQRSLARSTTMSR